MSNGRSKDVLEYVLARLIKYAHDHFKAEEGVLQAHAYQGLEVHKVEHPKFMQTARHFQRDFLTGKAMPNIDVMVFFRDWFSEHTQSTDQKYAPFLKERGVV